MDDYETDWSQISFEKPKKADAVEAAPAVKMFAGTETKLWKPLNGVIPWSKSCPSCGRVLGKGGHFHVKHCKGGE